MNRQTQLGAKLGGVLAPGDTVRVGAGDETIQRVGEAGIVLGYRSSSGVGGNPYDPFIEVQFADGKLDHYWREELTKV